jgi:integrase
MIIKRGNRYGVRIYVAKRQVWVGSFRTRQEARQAEREALMRVRPTNDETVSEFVERWLRDFKRPRASTNRHNAYMVKPLVAEFRSVKMSEISRRDAREWACRNRASLPVVRALFNDALNEECVTANPFANLRLDQRRGRRDLVALSETEVRDLADAALDLFGAYGPTFRACVLFAAYVGLRPAEMFVLQWSDLELAQSQIRINRSLGNTGEITLPKNGLRRCVVLPPQAREVLLAMPRRADSPYVFTTPGGQRFSKTSHYYYWRLLRLAAKRPDMAFYELRHFCATHLLELGVSHADVAVQLGHTDGGALVMSTYGHPSDEAARVRVLEAYRRNPAWRLKAAGE